MQLVRMVLRATAGFLAAGFALLTLAMPLFGVFNLWNEGGFSRPHPDDWLLGLAGYALTILAFCLFSALAALALFRYARCGTLRRSKASSNAAMISYKKT